jgi:hypothetical protein
MKEIRRKAQLGRAQQAISDVSSLLRWIVSIDYFTVDRHAPNQLHNGQAALA